MCLLPHTHLVIKVGSTCLRRKSGFELRLKKEPHLYQKSEPKEQENEFRGMRGIEEEEANGGGGRWVEGGGRRAFAKRQR